MMTSASNMDFSGSQQSDLITQDSAPDANPTLAGAARHLSSGARHQSQNGDQTAPSDGALTRPGSSSLEFATPSNHQMMNLQSSSSNEPNGSGGGGGQGNSKYANNQQSNELAMSSGKVSRGPGAMSAPFGNSGGAGFAAGSSSSSDQFDGFMNHQLANGANSQQQQQQQQHSPLTMSPFQYQSASFMVNKSPASSAALQALFSPSQQLMLSQASNNSPISSSSGSSGGSSSSSDSISGAGSNKSPVVSYNGDQLASSASDMQQAYALQSANQAQLVASGGGTQQQQTSGRNAILNQLTKLWSIVGKQRSLLPSIASPFGSKTTANMNQRQLQLMMGAPVS